MIKSDLVFVLVLSSGSGRCEKTGLLLLLSLRSILVEQFEELSGSILVKSVGELSDGGRNLETLV